jgi:hypothetical protein
MHGTAEQTAFDRRIAAPGPEEQDQRQQGNGTPHVPQDSG